MVARKDVRRVSVEQWRVLEAESHDAKHEYVDGQAYAMSGGTLDHARIGFDAARALNDALGDGLCSAYNSDAAVRLSLSRYVYPDITVTCDDEQGTAKQIGASRVVVEVLSDTREAYDRGRKFAFYRACPAVQEYMIVATSYQGVDVYRRAESRWTYESYGPGDDIELESIGVRLTVDALYRRTTIPLLNDLPDGL